MRLAGGGLGRRPGRSSTVGSRAAQPLREPFDAEQRGYRTQNLRVIWPWLPSFRVVAELQHLTEAAKRLGVTPAALSRSIAKLERALGVQLFKRVPRGMLLTKAGAQLADSVRDSMRRFDDTVSALAPGELPPAKVRIAFDGAPIGMLLDHCLDEVLAFGLRVEISVRAARRLAEGLLAGDVDLGLASRPSDDDRVVCKPLGTLPLRWVTESRQPLPPRPQAASLVLPPAVAPPSRHQLRQTVLLIPEVVPVDSKARTLDAEPMTLWRLTRSRPSRGLLRIAERIGASARS